MIHSCPMCNVALMAAIMLIGIVIGWYLRRRHKKKETEIRAVKSAAMEEIKKTCAAAQRGDSEASIRMEAVKQSLEEKSIKLTGRPKPPTTVIPGGINPQ